MQQQWFMVSFVSTLRSRSCRFWRYELKNECARFRWNIEDIHEDIHEHSSDGFFRIPLRVMHLHEEDRYSVRFPESFQEIPNYMIIGWKSPETYQVLFASRRSSSLSIIVPPYSTRDTLLTLKKGSNRYKCYLERDNPLQQRVERVFDVCSGMLPDVLSYLICEYAELQIFVRRSDE
jgi:hypothetical protein